VLVAFRELLEERRAAGTALGAFTCYDVTTALGVLRAAEDRDEPVVLLLSESSFRRREGHRLAAALLAVAHESSVGVCVQLDHVSDRELIAASLAVGVGAVMADGSRLPMEENVAFVRAIRGDAQALGVGIEAELGHIEGGEDVASATAAGALTEPDEAAAFVVETAVDCLAVSIGNVHGPYASPPQLDWERLARIRERVDLPLSLHGSSGLPDADVRRAIELGVCKVNVNTELRARYLAELELRIPEVRRGLRVLELEAALVAAVADVAGAKLGLLAG
jgi:tagatose 1,6-diphosphate aldolase GatY/KbaY